MAIVAQLHNVANFTPADTKAMDEFIANLPYPSKDLPGFLAAVAKFDESERAKEAAAQEPKRRMVLGRKRAAAPVEAPKSPQRRLKLKLKPE